MTRERTSTERQVASLGPWEQNLHLPDGTRTAPDHPRGDFPACNWRQLRHLLPSDLRGWHALDVGCGAGFYSLELARLGAYVTGIDVDPQPLRQARWAAEEFDLLECVRFERRMVYDLVDEAPYDLVLFLDQFDGLRYPLLALDLLSRLTGKFLVFQPGHGADAAERNVTEEVLRSAGLQPMKRAVGMLYLCSPVRPENPVPSEEFLAATGRPWMAEMDGVSRAPPRRRPRRE